MYCSIALTLTHAADIPAIVTLFMPYTAQPHRPLHSSIVSATFECMVHMLISHIDKTYMHAHL